MIENLATRIPVIDESVYHEPYAVKDGCLCERKRCIHEQIVAALVLQSDTVFLPLNQSCTSFQIGYTGTVVPNCTNMHKTVLLIVL